MFSISRWTELFQRKSFQNRNSSVSGSRNDNDIVVVVPKECYQCTQAGIPFFHSTLCPDPSHHPHWEASAGSSFRPAPTTTVPTRTHSQAQDHHHHHHDPLFPLGRVVDPRSKTVKRWNRVVLLARGMALAVDPLFFYVVWMSGDGSPCFYMDVALAMIVTVVRTCLDAMHLGYVWLQFRMAYVSNESMVVGCGKLVWDARAIASRYLRSLRGFWLDAFVIIPIPQIVIWIVVPKLLREEQIKWITRTFLLSFLFQFLPKIYHSIYLMKKLQKVTGYVFGSIWWRFNLNAIAYLIASHCLDVDGPFNYGIYNPVLLVFSSNSLAVRILYPVFWGLLNLSSFGNELEPTCNWLELIFSCCITLAGLILFVTLIGNIQVFLHTVMANKKKMQLKYRDMEWWMKRRQLPNPLRDRVRNFQRHSWSAMEGQDEMELIQHLPDGLRRDIKRFLCIDLVKKVPLFHMLDDLILDNICDRVRPLIYSAGEKIIREGDPVQRMVFIVRGRVNRRQGLSKGFIANSVVEPGGFFGDELLSWCLRIPAANWLPVSLATYTCIDSAEGYAIDAHQLRYVVDHFRYKFASESLKKTARYYSCNWRTWGAVVIQLAWRRRRLRNGTNLPILQNGDPEDRLRQYAAFFLSIRPHDHLE
ncbi:cyclic nucleotide-gated ion channel 2-like isoform X2 [Ziziphus jujuba]|uniref:Cyclic nucleotide-gated ion channel 2-like isoform X2 n=1 Tax=Ziziphus jujuba TaxID=326968 RepID=A0ABM4AF85_ZIZJJ|nr:cyclic nucleotide-gated ion channel 2-like isoform X2 [Ziziphus jujuba]